MESCYLDPWSENEVQLEQRLIHVRSLDDVSIQTSASQQSVNSSTPTAPVSYKLVYSTLLLLSLQLLNSSYDISHMTMPGGARGPVRNVRAGVWGRDWS